MAGEITRHEQTDSLTRSEEQTSLTPRQIIRRKLTAMAIARQAEMSEMDLRVYSKGLEDLPMSDIDAVIQHLSLTPREEFEPKIPELAVLRRKVQEAGWAKKRRAREAQEQREQEALRRRRLENPDEFVPIGKVLEEVGVTGLRNMDEDTPVRPAPPPPAPKLCPNCMMAESLVNDPTSLRRIAASFIRKAEIAEERMKVLEELDKEAAKYSSPDVK